MNVGKSNDGRCPIAGINICRSGVSPKRVTRIFFTESGHLMILARIVPRTYSLSSDSSPPHRSTLSAVHFRAFYSSTFFLISF